MFYYGQPSIFLLNTYVHICHLLKAHTSLSAWVHFLIRTIDRINCTYIDVCFWRNIVVFHCVSSSALKGLGHEIFEVGFFHQTTPPGPTRGSQEPFLILATFHGVIQVLKQCWGVANPQCPRCRGVENLRCLRHRGVENPQCSRRWDSIFYCF